MKVFKLRRVIASRLEPGTLLYQVWDGSFKTLEEAREYRDEFMHAENYDIIEYDRISRHVRVVVQHTEPVK